MMHNECGGATNSSGVQWLQWLLSPAGPFGDASPDNKVVIICDGHGSHLSLEFLQLCRARGVILILRPPHTSHITQGEDVINFFNLKGALCKQTALVGAEVLDAYPYNNILAWGSRRLLTSAQCWGTAT